MRLDEDRVRGARERRGLTLAMVAQRAGTSKNTVLSAEHGGDIRPTTARKIADALGVEITDLIADETYAPKAQAPSAETAERRVEPLADPQPVSAEMLKDAIDHMRTLGDMHEGTIRQVEEEGAPVPPLFSWRMDSDQQRVDRAFEAQGTWAAAVNDKVKLEGAEMEGTDMRKLCLQFEKQRSRLRSLAEEARIIEEDPMSDRTEEYVKGKSRAWEDDRPKWPEPGK